tara:strand:- start:1072 stop:2280 length:1209 start_codon:yes stop_codon:yes gene_type:complete
MVSWAKAPFSNFRQLKKLTKFSDNGPGSDIIWALNDVSFDVKKGEVLGIIGGNGVGKSTLLKILGRITNPTSGSCSINGRVASLLEVGTGFHSELSGRENVYLNGTILGMNRKEIRSKFNEIVDFSGIEKFIDTPVKRYSSGMGVRLAFAVAAHLEPEILLIDEVLAIGDADFQKRCLKKMDKVARSGRTILFVSHQMNAITNLCDRVVWLDNGSIVDILPAKEAVQKYLMSSYSNQAPHIEFKVNEDKPAQGISMRLMNNDGESLNQFLFEDDINVKFDYLIRKTIRDGHLCCQLFNSDGSHLMVSYDFDHAESNCSLDVGRHCVKFKIPRGILSPGLYYINMRINSSLTGKLDLSDSEDDKTCSFVVDDISGLRGNKRKGMIAPRLPWYVSDGGNIETNN